MTLSQLHDQCSGCTGDAADLLCGDSHGIHSADRRRRAHPPYRTSKRKKSACGIQRKKIHTEIDQKQYIRIQYRFRRTHPLVFFPRIHYSTCPAGKAVAFRQAEKEIPGDRIGRRRKDWRIPRIPCHALPMGNA